MFDPRKSTDEVDLIFDIELGMIDQYKAKGHGERLASRPISPTLPMPARGA